MIYMCLGRFENRFRIFTDLDKCEAFIIAIPVGINQKSARTFKNGLIVFEWRVAHMCAVQFASADLRICKHNETSFLLYCYYCKAIIIDKSKVQIALYYIASR